MRFLRMQNIMGFHSNNRLPESNFAGSDVLDVHGLVNSDNSSYDKGNKGTMATAIKLFFSSPLANYLGWSVSAFWLLIDLNDIKIMVLGIMSMIWVTCKGFLSLYSYYMKIQREKMDFDEYRELKSQKKIEDAEKKAKK